MPLGKLDRSITIQTFTTSKDDYGEPVKTWSTHKNVWAEKIGVNSKAEEESTVAMQTVNTQKVQWRIRYDSTVTEKMRISYDGDYYNILGLIEEGRERYLLINSLKTDG